MLFFICYAIIILNDITSLSRTRPGTIFCFSTWYDKLYIFSWIFILEFN